jgi:tripartite-type tricarboxylate transporter receptor subunit TctC
MTDLMGGQIDAMCDSAPNIVAHVLAGTIRALVVAQPSRVTAVPAVPDAKEAGLPDFNVVGWNAIVAPPRTPKEIVAKANDALKLALTDPRIRKKIEDLGATPPNGEETSPEWMDKFLRAEVGKWGAVIRAAGVSVD